MLRQTVSIIAAGCQAARVNGRLVMILVREKPQFFHACSIEANDLHVLVEANGLLSAKSMPKQCKFNFNLHKS